MEDEEKPKLPIPSSSPENYPNGIRSVSSGIANYVPIQRPELNKRYKMYTRDEIMSAIDAVKHGMSALQAAKLYGVPSRTLYDKVCILFLHKVNSSRTLDDKSKTMPWSDGTFGKIFFCV